MTDHPNLAAALAAFQAEMPTVHKGKTAKVPTKSGGSYSYDYADLADMAQQIHPILARHGLAFTALPRATDAGYELAAVLMHTTGERVEGALPIRGGTPQEWGSSLTYMRRYLLGCLTGVVTDADDDGALATAAARKPAPPAPPAQPAALMTDKQRARLHALVGELGIDRDKKLEAARWAAGRPVESTSELTTAEAAKLIDFLDGKRKERANAPADA